MWTAMGFIAALIAVQLLGDVAQAGVYLFLAAWAFVSPLATIQALSLAWLTTYLNPGIFPPTEFAAALRWLPVAVGAVRTIGDVAARRKRYLPHSLVALVVFVAFAAAVSIGRSYALEISLLRLASFTVGAATILLCFQITRADRSRHERWFTGLFAIVVLGGLPLIVHQLGYVQNSRGFQGLLSHPQSYGTFLGPVVAWLTARLVIGRLGGYGGIQVLTLLAGWVSLFATESRTALLGAAGGCVIAFLLVLPRSPLLRRRLRSRLLNPLAITAGMLLVGVITLQASVIQRYIRNFATKGHTEMVFVESVERSRGALVLASWSNFLENPVLGTGFGLASDPRDLGTKSVQGLPIVVQAPVEKGFLPTTVLEEVGLVGAAIFLFLILALVKPHLLLARLDATAVSMAALMTNLGEMTFFALGGMGLFVWLMLGFGYVTR